jgi:hypothetical protein
MGFEKRHLIKQQLPLCGTVQQFKFVEKFSELIQNLSEITVAT